MAQDIFDTLTEQPRAKTTDIFDEIEAPAPRAPAFESPLRIEEGGPVFQSALDEEAKAQKLWAPRGPKPPPSLTPITEGPGFQPVSAPSAAEGLRRTIEAPEKLAPTEPFRVGEIRLPEMDEANRKRQWLKSQFNQEDLSDEEFLAEHPNLKYAMYGFMGPTDMPAGRISTQDAKNLGFGKLSGVVAGAQNTVADFADFMTSAPGIMTTLTGGVAGAAAGAGQVGLATATHKGIAYTFAADMARQLPDQFAAIAQAIEDGNTQEATRGILNAAVSLGVIKHGVKMAGTPTPRVSAAEALRLAVPPEPVMGSILPTRRGAMPPPPPRPPRPTVPGEGEPIPELQPETPPAAVEPAKAWDDIVEDFRKRGNPYMTRSEIQEMYAQYQPSREAAGRLARDAWGDKWKPGERPAEAPAQPAPTTQRTEPTEAAAVASPAPAKATTVAPSTGASVEEVTRFGANIGAEHYARTGGLDQFRFTDPTVEPGKPNQITFAVPEGSPARVIAEARKLALVKSRVAEGIPEENIRISVTREQVDPASKKAIPGTASVQVDEINHPRAGNVFSANPELMIRAGLEMPTSEQLLTLPQGRYTLAEAKTLLTKKPTAPPAPAPAPAPTTPFTAAVKRATEQTPGGYRPFPEWETATPQERRELRDSGLFNFRRVEGVMQIARKAPKPWKKGEGKWEQVNWPERMGQTKTADEGRALFSELDSEIAAVESSLGMKPSVGQVGWANYVGFNQISSRAWKKRIADAKAIDAEKARHLAYLLRKGNEMEQVWNSLRVKQFQAEKAAAAQTGLSGMRDFDAKYKEFVAQIESVPADQLELLRQAFVDSFKTGQITDVQRDLLIEKIEARLHPEEAALPKTMPSPDELKNMPLPIRLAGVEFRVNQDIIDSGKEPTGQKATPQRIEELKKRQKQVLKNYADALAELKAPLEGETAPAEPVKPTPAPEPAPAPADVEKLLTMDVPDVTEAKTRLTAIDKRRLELTKERDAVQAQIKEVEKLIKPQRGSHYTRSRIKASAKKSDVTKYRELEQRNVELSRQIQGLDEASREDRQAVDRAADAKIVSDKSQPLIRRLDRAARMAGGKPSPELLRALDAETERLILEKYPDATPAEIKRLAPEVQRASYFGNTVEQLWKEPNLPSVYDLRRAHLDALVNAPGFPKHLFPPEFKEKLDRFRRGDRTYGGKIEPNAPVEDLSAKDIASLEKEIAKTSEEIRAKLKADAERQKAEDAAEAAKAEELLVEAQKVADSAPKFGKPGAPSAKQVKSELVSRIGKALDELIAKDDVRLTDNGDVVKNDKLGREYSAQGKSAISFGRVEKTEEGKFKVTTNRPGDVKRKITVTVDTMEEAQWVIKAMAAEGRGQAVIGVPGDGVFRLNRSGQSILGVWADARKIDTTPGTGKIGKSTAKGEAPPKKITTLAQWNEAKEYHGLKPTDKIYDWSPALRELATRINPSNPKGVSVKGVDVWIEKKLKETAKPAEAPTPPAEAAPPAPEGEPPGPAIGQGPGARTYQPAVEPPESVPYTSLKNAIAELERKARGFKERTLAEKQEMAAAWLRAGKILETDPRAGERVAERVIVDPTRALSGDDSALLLRYKLTLENAINNAAELSITGTGEAKVRALAEHTALSAKLNDLLDAVALQGTALGRAFRWRQALAYEDYSFAAQERLLAAAKGRPLSESERTELQAKIAAYQDKIAALEKHQAERETRLVDAAVKEALDKLEREGVKTRRYSSQVLEAAEKFASYMDKKAEMAAKRIRERAKTMGAAPDPTVVGDLAIVGAAKLTRGVVELTAWSEAMVKDFGDWVKPHLEKAYDAAKELLSVELEKLGRRINRPLATGVKKVVTEAAEVPPVDALIEKIKKRIEKNENPQISPLVRKLYRAFLEEGVRGREVVLDAVHEALMTIVPDISRLDVRKMIAGYGEYRLLPKDAISILYRAYKGEMREQAKLEDMAEGIAPARSGVEMATPTAEERAFRQQVAEAKKQGGYTVTDPELQLRTAMDAIKRRLENQIIDLQKQISTRERIVKDPTKIEYDEEATKLKAVRDELKRQFDEIFPKRPLTEAERLQLWKERTQARIEDIEEMMRTGDIEIKPRRPGPILDEEGRRLQAALDKVKDELKHAREKAAWERMTFFEKATRGAIDTYDAARMVMTTGELSFILRQAKASMWSRPLTTMRALPAMFDAFRSWERAHAQDLKVFNDPLYPAARKAGLFIVDERATLTRQEEIYAGRWAHALPVISNFNFAARVFLNKVRFDTWKAMRNTFSRFGEPTPPEEHQYAMMVNEMTGRGRLGRMGEPAAVLLGRTFFAPRYAVSRFQLLAGHALWGGTARSRAVIAMEYARMLVGAGLYLALLNAYFSKDPKHKKLVLDWRSADLYKVALGETRLDVMAGLAQAATFLGRTFSGQTMTQKGKILPLRATEGRGIKFGEPTWVETAGRFARSKLHPIPGTVIDLFNGTSMDGRPVTLKGEAGQLLAPITYRDIYQALKAQDLDDGTVLALLAFLGEGLQTYQARGKQPVTNLPAASWQALEKAAQPATAP